MKSASERGQATAEFALMLPLFFGLLGLCVQMVGVGLDQLAIAHFAREIARSESVDRRAASVPRPERLDRARTDVAVAKKGGLVTVRVVYNSQLRLPFTGTVILRPQLHSHAVMWVEHDP